jgi:hypothetical protein
MAINPISWAQPNINSQADFTGLSGLGQIYREAQNRDKLAALGKGLADGSIDYKQAAAASADMGNVDATLKFLALQQQRDELLGTERAGQVAAAAMPGIVGAPPASANAGTIAPPPTVTPGPTPPNVAINPAAPTQTAALSTGEPAPVTGPVVAPNKDYAAPGGTVNGIPQDEAQARQNIARISQVLALRNLPAGARSTYEKLLDFNLQELKDPAEIKKLRALGDPVLMARELELRRASKPETNVTTKGEEAESKAQGEATVNMFKEVAMTAPAARQQKAQLAQLDDLSTKFKTGGPAAVQAYLANNLGIKVGKNVSDVEAYSSIIDAMTPAQRIPGSGTTTDKDAAQFKKGLPQIINSPEGNAIIRGTHIALADDKIAQADIAQRYLTKQITAKQALAETKALPDPFSLYKDWKAKQDNPTFSDRFGASQPSGVAPAADGWSAQRVP